VYAAGVRRRASVRLSHPGLDGHAHTGYVRVALRLQMLGHEAYTAASVQEAIAALETKHVDAVVSDRSMAGGSGLDLLAYVRARWPDLPFILASGYVDQELEALAYGGGADWVYAKYDLLEALPEHFPPVRVRIAA
jgi:CheY-like chemotaxis protein